MSYTLANQPAIISPAFNPLIFRVHSDLYTATGFNYLFKIYRDSTLISTQRHPPMPDNYGIVDVSKIIKSYISNSLQPDITNCNTSSGSVVRYKVAYGYEVAGGVVTAITNPGTVVTMAIQNNTTSALNGKKLETLILNGLTLSHTGPYWVKFNSGVYELYRDSALTLPVTATGSFQEGFLQTTDAAIATSEYIYATSGEKLAVNMVFDYDSFLDFDSADYLFYNSTSKQWLTNSPVIRNISRNDYFTLSFLQNYSYNTDVITIEAYTASDVLIGSFDLSNADTISYNSGTYVFTNPANLAITAGVGYMNLFDLDSNNDTTDSTCAYYLAIPKDTDNNQSGTTFRFNLVDECSRHDIVKLMWLNHLGGWDFFSFKKTNETSKVSKSTYKKTLPYNYSKSDRGEAVYHSQSEIFYSLNTDFIDSETATWLSGIFYSPEVFIIDDSASLTPVLLTNDTFTGYIRGKDKLKNYQIELKKAHKKPSNAA